MTDPTGSPPPYGPPGYPPTPPLETGPGTWPPPSPPSPPYAGYPGPAWAYPTPPRKRSRVRRIVALAVVGVGVLGSAAFAVTALVSTSGAASPEEAVQVFLEALANEDAVGVVAALPAGEREALGHAADDLVAALQERDILTDELSLGGIEGVEVQFEDLELDIDELADTVAAVRLSDGDMIIETVADELPFGDTLVDLLDAAEVDLDDTSEEVELADRELVLVAIDDGDGWHVSIGYSVAESARLAEGLDEPDFGEGVQPRGADSPAAAVEAFLDAFADLDLEEMIARLHPGEAAALHDYAPLFLDEGQDAIDEARENGELQITIDDLDLETGEVDGGNRVDITALTLDSSTADGDFELVYDGQCAKFDGDVDDLEFLAGEDHELCSDDSDELGVVLGGLFNVPFHYITVERSGRFFISPVRTVASAYVDAIGAVDDDVLDDADFEALFFGELGQRFEDLLEEAFEEDLPDGSDLPPAPEDGSFSGTIGTAVPPEDLGDDADLQALADECFSGEFPSGPAACDDLFFEAPFDSAFGEYGLSCGGRRDSRVALGTCEVDLAVFTPGPPQAPTGLGDDPELQPYADACFNGHMMACDRLFIDSDIGSDYETYAMSCGGRLTDDLFDECAAALGLVIAPPANPIPAPAAPAGVIVNPPQPATGLGDDPSFQPFADACRAGSMLACDELVLAADFEPPYADYAATCGGRLSEPPFSCEDELGPRAPN